jgi:hypothetical protein
LAKYERFLLLVARKGEQDGTFRTRQPIQNSQDRTAWMGLPRRYARTGQPGDPAKTEQPGQDSQAKTARTELPGKNS